MKVVEIRWLDSLTQSPWTDLDETKQLLPVTVISVGYLVYETETAITIAGMIGLENCMSMIQVIPKGCILTISTEYPYNKEV